MSSKISNNFNILVVDDDKFSLFVEAGLFEFLKVMPDSAQTNSEALSLIQTKHYDAALIDIDSNYAIDSLGLIKKIQHENRQVNKKTGFSTLLFGIVTAFNQYEEEEQYAHTCFKLGMIDICARPVPQDFIKHILHSCQVAATIHN